MTPWVHLLSDSSLQAFGRVARPSRMLSGPGVVLSLHSWSLLLKPGLEFCTGDNAGEVGARDVGKCREKEGREDEGYRIKSGSPVSSLDRLEESCNSQPHCGMAHLTLLLEWWSGHRVAPREHQLSFPHVPLDLPQTAKPGGTLKGHVSPGGHQAAVWALA